MLCQAENLAEGKIDAWSFSSSCAGEMICSELGLLDSFLTTQLNRKSFKGLHVGFIIIILSLIELLIDMRDLHRVHRMERRRVSFASDMIGPSGLSCALACRFSS